jgi:hypothetical protein
MEVVGYTLWLPPDGLSDIKAWWQSNQTGDHRRKYVVTGVYAPREHMSTTLKCFVTSLSRHETRPTVSYNFDKSLPHTPLS